MGEMARFHDGHEPLHKYDSDRLGEWGHSERKVLADSKRSNK